MNPIIPRTIVAYDPDTALEAGLWWLKSAGVEMGSRNGPVLKAPAPVITTYANPRNRVLFSALRDANPFFHLYEALWMLAGKHDAASVARYAAQMESFADPEGDLWGAYGWRWRSFFGFDQLQEIIDALRKDPTTRRAVLTMWAPNGDLVPMAGASGSGIWASKDVPCNTHVYFDGTSGALDMTVCNRSNDVVWGAYGANLVHMSILHEFIAGASGLPLGVYHQMSNNYHMYTNRPDVQRLFSSATNPLDRAVLFQPDCRYGLAVQAGSREVINPMPIYMPQDNPEDWMDDCEKLVADPTAALWTFHSPWFAWVAKPMMDAHHAYKEGRFADAMSHIAIVRAPDWRVAGAEWIARRAVKAQQQQQQQQQQQRGVE